MNNIIKSVYNLTYYLMEKLSLIGAFVLALYICNPGGILG
ncbi:hypothetical protein OLMES_5545 [Oleiphilus messinensis]|uniref:Uncharacterized protein n=1 Tax=Oleiphilus messinensis TaxID=141451 RepID=A0A1Y0IJ27_9GAMM|nr:hypothetical protein OLMES_5545 [Oleiphilus messinensis]